MLSDQAVAHDSPWETARCEMGVHNRMPSVGIALTPALLEPLRHADDAVRPASVDPERILDPRRSLFVPFRAKGPADRLALTDSPAGRTDRATSPVPTSSNVAIPASGPARSPPPAAVERSAHRPRCNRLQARSVLRRCHASQDCLDHQQLDFVLGDNQMSHYWREEAVQESSLRDALFAAPCRSSPSNRAS